MWAVLFTGTRHFNPRTWDGKPITDALDRLPKGSIVIVGGAPGVDTFVAQEARKRDLNVHEVPALWDELGKKKAGPIRNSLMVELLQVFARFGYKTIVLAFPDDNSIGTKDCIKKAKKAGFTPKGATLRPRPLTPV